MAGPLGGFCCSTVELGREFSSDDIGLAGEVGFGGDNVNLKPLIPA